MGHASTKINELNGGKAQVLIVALAMFKLSKHTKEKDSNSNNLLSHAFTCSLIPDTGI